MGKGGDSLSGVEALCAILVEGQPDAGGQVVGMTGSVAVGKTTLAGQIAEHLAPQYTVETVSTDGFLFPNAVLTERGLMMRKGFPETYDRDAFEQALRQVRTGSAAFPAHSHVTYDIDPALTRHLNRPDMLLLEGLGFEAPGQPPRHPGEPDVLIYIDAAHEHIVEWYIERFVRLWRAAEHDPASFYAQFRHMTEPELIDFARSVWDRINQPNLEENILPLRDVADIVVLKDKDHSITLSADRRGRAGKTGAA